MIEIKFEKTRAAAYDNETLVGECDFSIDGKIWTIYHTEVNAAFSGQGVARQLVKCVAENAADSGAKIKPECSFVAREFEKRPEIYAAVRL